MKSVLVPPIGFALPAVCAMAMAFWSLPDIPAFDEMPAGHIPPAPFVQSTLDSRPILTDLTVAQAAFSSRPLLAEDRQLPQLEPPPVEEVVGLPEPEPLILAEPELPPIQPPNPPQVQATGMIEIDGQMRVLFRNLETGNETWSAKGDQLGSWTLVEITQVAAILEAQGVQVTIKLFEDTLP